VFTALTISILVLRFTGADALADGLRWPNAILGLLVAGYTAFLFAQCKGRDLWEGRLLLPHLLVLAVLSGAVALLPAAGNMILIDVVLVSGLLHLCFIMIERYGHHPTDNARQAAAFLGTVRLWGAPAFAQSVVLIIFSFFVLLAAPGIVWIPVLLGLFYYEHTYVRAAQLPPLS
jgi:hypothetical protein